jgi:hypothetical protein
MKARLGGRNGCNGRNDHFAKIVNTLQGKERKNLVNVALVCTTLIIAQTVCAYLLDGIVRWSALAHLMSANKGAKASACKVFARTVTLLIGSRLFALLWLLDVACSIPKGGIRGVCPGTLVKYSHLCTAAHAVALPNKTVTKTWWSGNALYKTEYPLVGGAIAVYALVVFYRMVFSWWGQFALVCWALSLPGPVFRGSRGL